MTRGRQDNRVYVVTDAATKGHGYQIPPTPSELLPAVIRRSSAERSATEPLRAELDRGDDRELRRRLHDQAVTLIEIGAGPDPRPELHGLQRLRASLPLLRDIVAVNHRISAQLRHLHCLQAERDGAAAELDRSRQRFTETERTVERIPEAQAAIARRRDWFLSHPAELAWEAELAARLGRHSTAVDPRTRAR